jgi:hypothetical protein
MHDEAALLAHQQDQFVTGHAPFAVEAAFFLLKFLTATERALGQTLLLDVLILIPRIAHDQPPGNGCLKDTTCGAV